VRALVLEPAAVYYFTYVVQAAKGVSTTYDEIEALFARLQEALDRMKVHIGPVAATSGGALERVLVNILAHILNVFALVTVCLDGRDSKYGCVRSIKKKIPPRLRKSVQVLASPSQS